MQNFNSAKQVKDFLNRSTGRVLIICREDANLALFTSFSMFTNTGNSDESYAFNNEKIVITTTSTMRQGIRHDTFDHMVGFKLKAPDLKFHERKFHDAMDAMNSKTEPLVSTPTPKVPSVQNNVNKSINKGVVLSQRVLSPIKLEVLLHCYYTVDPFPKEAPAVTEALVFLERHDMIELCKDALLQENLKRNPVYTTTEKGKCYIDFLLNIPLPVNTWVVPLEAIKNEFK